MSRFLKNKRKRRNQKIKKYAYIFIALLLILFIFAKISYFISNSSNSNSAPRPLPKETVVILTDKGFSPKNITIAKDGAVRWINNSKTSNASVNSDNYPTNQLYPELNLGQFNKGSTLVHIFTIARHYSYHDQFNPKFVGVIEVK